MKHLRPEDGSQQLVLEQLLRSDPAKDPTGFSVLLDQLELPSDQHTLLALLGLFREDANEDVMFSLVHAVETYPSPVYASCLVSAAEKLSRHAPSWLGILFMRLLNANDDAILLERELRVQPGGGGLAAIAQVRRMFPDMAVELAALEERVTAERPR